jgi:TPR repeat protein
MEDKINTILQLPKEVLYELALEFLQNINQDHFDNYSMYMTMSANLGYEPAQTFLHEDYAETKYHMRQWWAFTKDFYIKTQNYAYSANYLGFMYDNGYGIEKDYKQAFILYKNAAVQKHPCAADNLAQLCKERPVNKKFDVLKWFHEIGQLDKLKYIYGYDDFIISLIKNWFEIREKIKELDKLKKENEALTIHIQCQPGGVEYFEAKAHWDNTWHIEENEKN